MDFLTGPPSEALRSVGAQNLIRTSVYKHLAPLEPAHWELKLGHTLALSSV